MAAISSVNSISAAQQVYQAQQQKAAQQQQQAQQAQQPAEDTVQLSKAALSALGSGGGSDTDHDGK